MTLGNAQNCHNFGGPVSAREVDVPQNIILTTTRWEVAEKLYKPGNLPTNVHKGAVQVERHVILNGCWLGG